MFANTGQLIYSFIIDDGLTLNQIAEEFEVSTRTLKYWLDRPEVREWYDRALERKQEMGNQNGVMAVDDYMRLRGCE